MWGVGTVLGTEGHFFVPFLLSAFLNGMVPPKSSLNSTRAFFIVGF